MTTCVVCGKKSEVKLGAYTEECDCKRKLDKATIKEVLDSIGKYCLKIRKEYHNHRQMYCSFCIFVDHLGECTVNFDEWDTDKIADILSKGE